MNADPMQYLKNLWHDLKLSVSAGVTQWRYIRRHLRRGRSFQ